MIRDEGDISGISRNNACADNGNTAAKDHEVHNISDNDSTDYDENFNFSD